LLANALRTSLAILREDNARRDRLFTRISHWRAVAASLPWRLLSSTTPIQPLMIGEADEAVAVSDALWECGIWVPAIRPPTVPAGSARLRVTLSAAHSEADVDRLVSSLGAIAAGGSH
jgi:8-amino-7-oxononanoate synthase